ncbi:MAG: 23S rRNA (pseudouridine(1915)-N(3))-methyltransferase RlmH, partial [Pseudomonadota bacterium]
GARSMPLAKGGIIVALDEKGRALSSRQFAGKLAAWRDDGAPEAAFLIGGADGHGPALIDRADVVYGFGPATWPHLLARAMICEQLYRAVTILAGHPYHRD